MGPQAHRQQLDKTLSYVAIGRGEGAELVTGGARIEREELAGGYFVEPTAFAGVSGDMRLAQEEIFGPIAAIIPFAGEEEAIPIAHDRNSVVKGKRVSVSLDSGCRRILKKNKKQEHTVC